MNIVSKAVATIQDSPDVDFGPNGGFIAVLSTPSEDRDGDQLERRGWIDPLPQRYALDIDHGMSIRDTVGSFEPYFEGDALMMKAYFASTTQAQETRTLVDEGHIRTVSVAFMNHKSKKDAGSPYRELLNAGIVAVPSNRDAVILASKAADALRDALKADPEGDWVDELTKAVSETLGVKTSGDNDDLEEDEDAEAKAKKSDDEDDEEDDGEEGREGAKGIYVDVIPRINPEVWSKAIASQLKAAGGEMALISAIHDASVHLGAQCVVPEPDPNDGDSEGANKSTEGEGKELSFEEFKSTVSQEDDPAPAPDEKSAAAAADSDLEARSRAMLMTLEIQNH